MGVLPMVAILVAALALPVRAADDWLDAVTLTFTNRSRVEMTDWFRPRPSPGVAPGTHRYAFFANQLRFGAELDLPWLALVVRGQDTRLAGLPDDASGGPGAAYFAHTARQNQGEVFLKEAYLTLRHERLAGTVGRFEYQDGRETTPADPTLAWVKAARIGERLVGPFGFTHVTRSLDGVMVVVDHPDVNVTALAAHPTHGGFEVSANREMNEVSLAGVAVTSGALPLPFAHDVRVFHLFYEDARDDPVRVDNRPLGVRVAEGDGIAIHTIGGHALAAVDAGPGRVDGLFWAALQQGEWGALDHSAWAWALEGGYQLPAVPGRPWGRVGYARTSGDDDPTDGEHGTFFQILPTARIYAQLPFFNLMNVEDLFAQLILRPHERVTLRTDWHWLRVNEARDLWYAGGGATNDDVFGFGGIPTGGRRELAHLLDLAVTATLHERATLYGYVGHAFGQGVVRSAFAGDEATFGYLELRLNWSTGLR